MLNSSSEGTITQGNIAGIAVLLTLPVPEAMFSCVRPHYLQPDSVLSPYFASFSFPGPHVL